MFFFTLGEVKKSEWWYHHIWVVVVSYEYFLDNLKVRIVVTPYLSGHITMIEWSQFHIRVVSVLKSGLNIINDFLQCSS